MGEGAQRALNSIAGMLNGECKKWKEKCKDHRGSKTVLTDYESLAAGIRWQYERCTTAVFSAPLVCRYTRKLSWLEWRGSSMKGIEKI